MSWDEAFAPIEAHYREEVMRDTWGHLAPRHNAKYTGHILFALGCFGNDNLNPTVVECSLVSRTCGELESSPWFYDYLQEFLHTQTDPGLSATGRHQSPEPGIYRFDGWFRNYQFHGTMRRLREP